MYTYLAELQERLFSEGLHVFGRKPSAEQAYAYLEAYYADALPADVLEAVSELREGEGVREAAARLSTHRPWVDQALVAEAVAAAAALRSKGGRDFFQELYKKNNIKNIYSYFIIFIGPIGILWGPGEGL